MCSLNCLFVYILCVMYVSKCWYACHSVHVEVRGQLSVFISQGMVFCFCSVFQSSWPTRFQIVLLSVPSYLALVLELEMHTTKSDFMGILGIELG